MKLCYRMLHRIAPCTNLLNNYAFVKVDPRLSTSLLEMHAAPRERRVSSTGWKSLETQEGYGTKV